ncbi:unnamed protein product [Rhizoctonia solani]|uniref:Uncharacterized protein n=1 Tax=Rhizoctonia solani TaxID=456999 RepID=A0A8H2WLH2_9AGAM|nr:unnamed protein product [Rhizoctonia solani]
MGLHCLWNCLTRHARLRLLDVHTLPPDATDALPPQCAIGAHLHQPVDVHLRGDSEVTRTVRDLSRPAGAGVPLGVESPIHPLGVVVGADHILAVGPGLARLRLTHARREVHLGPGAGPGLVPALALVRTPARLRGPEAPAEAGQGLALRKSGKIYVSVLFILK